MKQPKNVALVHDWLVSMRGGEKVLELLCELFPGATLFTLVRGKEKLSQPIEAMNIRTSFIQHLPLGTTHYQYCLPIFPAAIESLNLSEFDLVISSSHAVAKGVKVRKGALHICYCHTPMRYIWDQYEQYFGGERETKLSSRVMKIFLNSLRRWDKDSAKGVDQFIANSQYVQERIHRIYGRDSVVIYPPVDVQSFSLSESSEDYYLIVSALVPYKQVDVAVCAFTTLGKRLVVIGAGSEMKGLQAIAKSNIEFPGWVDNKSLVQYYQQCKALVFPGEEDFGIVPVEAMACGKPVIALGAGGALETVVDGKTGIFFGQQEIGKTGGKEFLIADLIEKIKKFESLQFDAQAIREHAMAFDRAICKSKLESFISEQIERWNPER